MGGGEVVGVAGLAVGSAHTASLRGGYAIAQLGALVPPLSALTAVLPNKTRQLSENLTP
jgi:hypothetical protein